MAISSCDGIGKMFELLAPALDDFISRAVASELHAGASWSALVAIAGQEERDRVLPREPGWPLRRRRLDATCHRGKWDTTWARGREPS